MKTYFTTIVLIALASLSINAQNTFERVYGENDYDEGFGAISYNNGYFIAGSIMSSSTSYDGCLIKTDSLGIKEWILKFGGTDTDKLRCIENTSNNNIIMCGQTASVGAGSDDAWIIKTDSLGNILWEKIYGGTGSDILYCIKETPDSGFIAVGETKSFGPNIPSNPNMYIIRMDINGDTLWTKALDYGGADKDVARSVTILASGSFVVTGNSSRWESTNLRRDLRLSKFDSFGSSMWSRTYYSTLPGDYEYGYAVKQTLDTGFVVAGYYSSIGWNYGVLLKTDSIGNYQWYSQVSGASFGDDAYVKNIDITSDSGFVMTGYISDPYVLSGDPLAIWKYDKTGSLDWTRIYGGSQADAGNFISTQDDNGFLVAGYTQSKSIFGSNDIYLIKTDSIGYADLQIWTSSDTTICEGDTAQLYVSSNHSGVTYSWLPTITIEFSDSSHTQAFPLTTQTYYVTVTSGIDFKVDSINVEVSPIPPTPTINYINDTLFSSSPIDNQWYNQSGVIVGANSYYYKPIVTGDYFVIVTNTNACISDTSNIINVVISSIEENNKKLQIQIYPNPTTGLISIKAEGMESIEVMNISGQTILKHSRENGNPGIWMPDQAGHVINLATQPKGIYIIKVTTNKGVTVQKIVLE